MVITGREYCGHRNVSYTQSSEGMTVTVTPEFRPDVSDSDNYEYVWSYEVNLHSKFTVPVQVMRRYWSIADRSGFLLQIHGEGVGGKQPIIEPYHSFSYTSHVMLRTSSGLMFGRYQLMLLEVERLVEIDIPMFSLEVPEMVYKAQ
jgi:ApaG protein